MKSPIRLVIITLVFFFFNPIVKSSSLETNFLAIMLLNHNIPAAPQQPIGNPDWGFQFVPPQGWSYQEIEGGLIMGHTTIPGIILIYPHIVENMTAVRNDLADGTYDEKYESGYSGDLSGGGNWNAYGAENAKGRWTVRGNRDQGTIIVIMANGEEIYYEYRVHEERGQKYYGEYLFNGKLYSKSGN
jgi:hypothetical protein